MGTTFATHTLPRRFRSQQAVFVALLALAIAVGLYGVVNNTSNTIDPVGIRPASALPNGIDPALVDALASRYPPVDQAADFRAAADRRSAASVVGSAIDPALVDALASHYPPVDQAAGYRAAAE